MDTHYQYKKQANVQAKRVKENHKKLFAEASEG